MDFLLLLVLGLLYWAVRGRRRFPRVVLAGTLIGAAIGAVVYPLGASFLMGLGGAPRDAGRFGVSVGATSLRGASIGGLIGLCVALVRTLPPRRPRRPGRGPGGFKRRPFA
jgi:hypothetical protein